MMPQRAKFARASPPRLPDAVDEEAGPSEALPDADEVEDESADDAHPPEVDAEGVEQRLDRAEQLLHYIILRMQQHERRRANDERFLSMLFDQQMQCLQIVRRLCLRCPEEVFPVGGPVDVPPTND